jgi:adenylyltransferase/sulfurtransferase
MASFRFSESALRPDAYRAELNDASCGGYASFEGWVRYHNEGKRVERLEYEAFAALAVREGERIVAEAFERFGVQRAACVHRLGDLAIGDLAVWVGVSAAHRAEAFAACRYIIDEVKHRVPIWKKEHYVDGDSGWVNCDRCAQGAGTSATVDATADAHVHLRDPSAHRHASGRHQEFVADYSRQMVLPEVGHDGQAKLEAAAVLVIGAGGLGVPVLQYLAAAGVGRIGIADGDTVEASNLHRQPLFGPQDIGRSKARVAFERLSRLQPATHFDVLDERASPQNVLEWLEAYHLVVDCSDNFATKFLVNDAAVTLGKPAVFASVYQYEGQLQVYLPRPEWPCLRCLWPEAPRDGLVGNCAQAGVLGPVPATLGAMQAMQALKILLGLQADMRPAVHTVDLLDMHWHTLKAVRHPACDHGARDPASLPQSTEDAEVDYASLDEARGSGLTLVDIREAWERATDDPDEQIEWHAPLSAIVEGKAALPRDGRYLIVCAHGVRSLALTEHLRAQGYASVYSLAGGLARIQQAGSRA